MKRIIVGIAILVSLSLISCSLVLAEEETFNIQATVPNANGVSIKAYSIPVGGGEWTAVGTGLDFGSMTYNSETGIYEPDHYYVIVVSPEGGAGIPLVTATYTEGANPNDAVGGNGLGWKATATFIKAIWTEGGVIEEALSAHGPKKLLKDITGGEDITSAELTGGWLRVYLGIVTKDAGAAYQDPAEGEVFSNSDIPGPYTGTLHISSTAL